MSGSEELSLVPGTDGKVVYRVRDLVKRYGRRTILDGVSFDVHRGECLIILGRSGTGKSVTLRQLNGLEAPDEGKVFFGDIDLGELTEKDLYPIRRRVAMLFQGGALFDSLTVYENLAFPLREHTEMEEAEIEDRIADRLEMVRMPGIEDRMPAALSGGMKKRVALARSLMLDPEVVLFDEPTTGLDPITSATIGSLINDIRNNLGVTAVVVTHDLALARTVGDRLAFLRDGRFAFLGTWEEADRSEDRSLAAFLTGKEDIDAA